MGGVSNCAWSQTPMIPKQKMEIVRASFPQVVELIFPFCKCFRGNILGTHSAEQYHPTHISIVGNVFIILQIWCLLKALLPRWTTKTDGGWFRT